MKIFCQYIYSTWFLCGCSKIVKKNGCYCPFFGNKNEYIMNFISQLSVFRTAVGWLCHFFVFCWNLTLNWYTTIHAEMLIKNISMYFKKTARQNVQSCVIFSHSDPPHHFNPPDIFLCLIAVHSLHILCQPTLRLTAHCHVPLRFSMPSLELGWFLGDPQTCLRLVLSPSPALFVKTCEKNDWIWA